MSLVCGWSCPTKNRPTEWTLVILKTLPMKFSLEAEVREWMRNGKF